MNRIKNRIYQEVNMKRILFAGLVISFLLGGMSSFLAREAYAGSYTSVWNDFTTIVPDGWRVSLDNEETSYTNTKFNSPEPYYSISVRWYRHYATHKLIDGRLEMYAGPADFINQLSDWYGLGAQNMTGSSLIEPRHEISTGDRKAQRFVGRLGKIPQKDRYGLQRSPADYDYIYGEWRRQLGGLLVGIDEVKNAGRQVWTIVPARSGFYVLTYYAPEESYGNYEKYYAQLVASFVPKDGPVATGSSTDPNLAQKIEQDKLDGLISSAKSKKNILFNQESKETMDYSWSDGPRKITVLTGRFVGSTLLEDIIKYVPTMKTAPAIPEGAKRNFVKAATFMKAAKEPSEFKDAISAYQDALVEAPWWGNAYYNMGVAFAGAGQYDEARESLNLYLQTNPGEPDKGQAQSKIYEIEAQQELQKKREAAVRAKYGNRQGGGYGVDDLYRYGAVVQNMSFDASGNERVISLKIVTRKESGFLRTYFQITDLTSRNDVYLQTFSADWRGTNTFYLDDRTSPNKQLMTMSVTSYGDGDANITIRSANNASAGIKTTLNGLLRELASQAVYAGDRMNIGGREFYVLAQGGAKGSLLFFPPEIKGMLESGSVRDMMPRLVANVNYRASDNTNARYMNSDLGDVNGTRYHLEYIGDHYEAKIGRGEDH